MNSEEEEETLQYTLDFKISSSLLYVLYTQVLVPVTPNKLPASVVSFRLSFIFLTSIPGVCSSCTV